MNKKVVPASSFDIARVAIFDDTHENVEFRINELFAEFGIKAGEIYFEQYIRYAGQGGERRTYAVIRYQQKNPAK